MNALPMLTFELTIWYLKKIQEAVFGVAHIKHKALKAMYLAYVDIRLPSALCTSITPFPSDRPHRLRSEFSGFLFALAWHTTELSLLLHAVIGD